MFLCDQQIALRIMPHITCETIKSNKDIMPDEVTGGMIDPFLCTSAKVGSSSYGLSSCGYDLRLGKEFAVFNHKIAYKNRSVILAYQAPSSSEMEKFTIKDGEALTIEPKEFVLAHTYEYIRMPNDLVGFIMDKSSLARRGLSLQNTVIEPGWEGNITLEIFNMSSRRVAIIPGMGVCQIMFSHIDIPVFPYSSRNVGGKYQGQTGVQEAK